MGGAALVEEAPRATKLKPMPASRLDVSIRPRCLLALRTQATWSYQGSTLEAFLRSNVDRVVIAPLGLLALAVGALPHGSRTSADPPFRNHAGTTGRSDSVDGVGVLPTNLKDGLDRIR